MPQRSDPTVRALFFMVLVAFFLRVMVAAAMFSGQLDPARDHLCFAYEEGRVARALATGRGFSDPLNTPTGPTAYSAPFFPLLLAGIFKLFGVYSKASAVVISLFDSLVSALTCIPVYLLARRSFGLRAASWAGWTWAAFPYGIYFPAERFWDTWLCTFLLAVILLVAFRLAEGGSWRMWVWYGLLWAIAGLNSPAVLAVLPLVSGWICVKRYRQKLPWFGPGVLSAVVFLALISPWFVRNYAVFGRFIPFRDTFGMELYLGNNGDTSHWLPREPGLLHNPAEYARFEELGELGYMARRMGQAVAYISVHRAGYVWLCARRAVYLWTGYWSFDKDYLRAEYMDLYNIPFASVCSVMMCLGLWSGFRRKAFGVGLYAAVLAAFPAVYYVTHPEIYYLRPLDPLIAMLAAAWAAQAWDRRRSARAPGAA